MQTGPPDLFSPGDHRAEDAFSGAALVAAMVHVEWCWLRALADAAIAPRDAARGLPDEREIIASLDLAELARAAERGGNPVIPLVTGLREHLVEQHPGPAPWLHRGLTSQDVIDTAIQLCARDAMTVLQAELKSQIDALAALAVDHEDSIMAGRTLTQHAVPITFGGKAARWMTGVLDARDTLEHAASRIPAQFGGAAGTLSALVAMARAAGRRDPEDAAIAATAAAADALGLATRPAWHTNRAPVTRLADALVTCTDAWGHIANDVLTLGRPEIAELAEPTGPGRGGSSTMPHKVNPVLSVLIHRTALANPPLAATLHLAAADATDERPDGAWHLEWAPLRTLVRNTLAAGSHTCELLNGLRVDTARMRRTVREDAVALLSEQQMIIDLYEAARPTDDPAAYLGVDGRIIESAIDRARGTQEETP